MQLLQVLYRSSTPAAGREVSWGELKSKSKNIVLCKVFVIGQVGKCRQVHFRWTVLKILAEKSTKVLLYAREKHFYFKMLITFEPKVAQRSVASQNDHKSKACLPEASNTAFTMYRRLKRRLRRLDEAPFLAPFFFGASQL